jgi:hypothetical protein
MDVEVLHNSNDGNIIQHIEEEVEEARQQVAEDSDLALNWSMEGEEGMEVWRTLGNLNLS